MTMEGENELLSRAFMTLLDNVDNEAYWSKFSHQEALSAYVLVATGARNTMTQQMQLMQLVRDLVLELRFAGLEEWADRIEQDVFKLVGWDSWETWDFAQIRDSLENPDPEA